MAVTGLPPPGPSHRALWLALALAALAIHLPALAQYGWFRDEFCYVACAKRLAWGYVDHPPLSVALLWLVRAVAGESLVALRLMAALVAAATVYLTGWLAHDLCGSCRSS